jgi:uncharacterized protein with ParB-like and HNH nuclease domain
MNDLLQNIETIFKDKGYLSFHGKNYYNIPLYQRGYKWTTKQVLKLLDDIDRFTPNPGQVLLRSKHYINSPRRIF